VNARSRPTVDATLILIAALAVVTVPHATRQPLWVTILFLLLVGWRVAGDWRGWPLPGGRHRGLNLLKHAMAMLVFVAVAASYGGHLGRDAGVALLVVLLGLKLIELSRPRDFHVAGYLGYFLVATNFLYTQSIAMALYMLVGIGLLTTALVALHDRCGSLGIRARARIAATVLLQAGPLMLVLFVLFPRLPGPLWGLPRDAHSGISGLRDEMMLGNISSLTLSDAIVFRVEFEGALPPVAGLYWRGPVFWHNDGRTWTAGRKTPGEEVPVPARGIGAAVRYTVTLEPSEERWLYALDLPTELPEFARRSRDFQLSTARRIEGRLRYHGTSHTDYRVTAALESELQRALALPVGRHPRAVALGQSLRQRNSSARAVIAEALRLFGSAPFVYTLRPPAAVADPVDEFLFRTRQGFCEHYAVAFAVLMRAAGIPTRVVTGYQGGEYNPIGGYLIVRQRDAHAWTEVWLGERGWMRVDPTAAVAPDRLERGIDMALPAMRELPLGSDALGRLWRGIRNRWDAMNNGWNQWVLGYGTQRQAQLLARWGMGDPNWARLSLWLVAALGALMALLLVYMTRTKRAGQDPIRAEYDRYCDLLARAGWTRAPWEGPLDFAARASAGSRELAPGITRVARLYVRARYERDPAAARLMPRAVRALRARLRAGPRIHRP
jgi:transglutaminase-like putative cysteine protease